MRIVVITSGTGAKAVESSHPLTDEDFRRGAEHVASKIRDRPAELVAAEDLYAGDQHLRLMRGVQAVRERWPDDPGPTLDLYVVSPGYGLVGGGQRVLPYDASFERLNPSELRERSDRLGIPSAFRRALLQKFDVAFLLLGHAYLSACAVDDRLVLGGPTYVLGGGRAGDHLPEVPNLRRVPVGQAEAAALRCPLFCLKGEIVGGWLRRLSTEPALLETLMDGTADIVTGWRTVP